MDDKQIILIVFRLLNFAVLLGMVVYLWKKYGRSLVVSEYEKEHESLKSLSTMHTVLHKQERDLQKIFTADTHERSTLKERLFIWREAIQKEQDELALEKEKRMQALNDRMNDQVKRVSEYRLYQQLQKEVIEQVRDRLRTEYATDAKQQEVLKSVMQRLERA